ESDEENKQLRKRIYDLESKADHFRVEQLKMREDNVKYFSEANEALKNQLKDLESRMDNLRHLFAETNEQYLIDKQREISTLQKSLLEEMDKALHQKQELLWAEEQMFAEGVAHRVRTTLVSLQGQLLFTLERLGLLDPESKTEAFWKTRWHLLFQGASELSENFQAIQTQLQDVTRTLDDFMHLTKRREISREPVDMKALVQKEMAEVYVDRQPTLSLEFFTDDPLPYVKGDRELLAFLVRTLLRNALETLPNGAGKIEITLKNQSAQGQVQIFVRDSGEGIPSYLLPRLFQPFFTTKDGRQGLNLSRAKKYAEFHGGTLELVKTDKEGTTFRVDLSIEGGA
ncbi:MAG: HAMP domain-containing histidine kinase, partial [Elusimicrobia bacterium]|nr:HAMP domain-containing histidine kinase [Candidatus Obscuribacterium magneticum]